jgi:putative oxidoreductase
MDLRRAVPRTFEEAAEGGRAGPGSTGFDTGMLLLRLVVGWTMAVHGAQKLLGWFGGPGFAGTARFLEHMGFRPGELHAVLSGGAELGGGLLLALGLLTPLGAAAVTGSMLAATATVTWQNGFISAKGGYEYNLVLIAAVLALTEVGPGELSVDHLAGRELDGPAWALAALALGIGGAVGAHALAAATPPPAAPAEPAASSETAVGADEPAPATAST